MNILRVLGMVWGLVAMAGATLLSGAMGARSQRSAAKSAQKGGEAGIEEQRRQFDLMQKLLSPYVEGGEEALGAQQALIGLQGPGEQQQAIDRLAESPAFLANIQQGEEAILQNASATGGLRGGNVQGALAQFRPQMLANTIQNQYANLGGLAQLGQASAAGVGGAGIQTGAGIANTYGDMAANVGASKLAQAKTYGDTLGNLAGLFAAQQKPPAPTTGGLF